MDLLVALVERRGEVVTQDELRARVWPDTFVAESAVFRLVSDLRRDLGDSPRTPRYIQTIPKRGYRLVAPVVEVSAAKAFRRRAAAGAVVLLAAVLLWWGVRASRTGSAAVRASKVPESYAIGEVLEDRVDCEAYDRARTEFEQALSTRPDYRPTYGHLVDSYLAAAVLGCIPAEPARLRIEELVSLRGRWESEHQRIRHQAAARFWLRWDFSAAGELFRQVPELPDVSRAAYLLHLKRPGEAIAEAERAWELDPGQLGEGWTVATMRLFIGDYGEAHARYGQVLSVYPGYPPAVSLSALAALLDGRASEALTAARQAAATERESRDRFATVPAMVLARLGKDTEAHEFLDRWNAAASQAKWVAPTAYAAAALARGFRDEAIRHLEEGVRLRDPWMVVAAVDPTFADLRGERAFQTLVNRLK